MSLGALFDSVATDPSSGGGDLFSKNTEPYKWPAHLPGQTVPSSNATKTPRRGHTSLYLLFRIGCIFLGQCYQQMGGASCNIAAFRNLLAFMGIQETAEMSGILDTAENNADSQCTPIGEIIPNLIRACGLDLNPEQVMLSDATDMITSRSYLVSLTDDSPSGVGSHTVLAQKVSDTLVRVFDSQSGWVCDTPIEMFNAWLTAGTPEKKGYDEAFSFLF